MNQHVLFEVSHLFAGISTQSADKGPFTTVTQHVCVQGSSTHSWVTTLVTTVGLLCLNCKAFGFFCPFTFWQFDLTCRVLSVKTVCGWSFGKAGVFVLSKVHSWRVNWEGKFVKGEGSSTNPYSSIWRLSSAVYKWKHAKSLTTVYRATIGNTEGSSPTETKTKAMKKTKTKTKTLGQTIWIWLGRQNMGKSQATAQHQLFSHLCSHTRRLNRPSSF